MNARLFFAVSAVAAGLTTTGTASAEGRDLATAQALFEAARQAITRGDYSNACPKFSESQRLDPAAGTLLNLADCEEHLGHLAAAWVAWHEGVALLPRGDNRIEPAQQRAQALDKRLPHLVIKLLPDAPADSRVQRDEIGIGIASLGVPLPVDPGPHVVRVEAAGHTPSSIDVTLTEGETRTIEVSPGAASPSALDATSGPPPASAPRPAPVPERAPGARIGLRTAGWIVGGAGIAGLGVGAVTGLLAVSKKGVMNDHCDPTKGCDSTGYDAAHAGHTLAITSDIGFAVGAGLIAGAVWLVLSGGTGSGAPPGTTALVVTPSPAGSALSLFGSF